jgi:hypothetical protein
MVRYLHVGDTILAYGNLVGDRLEATATYTPQGRYIYGSLWVRRSPTVSLGSQTTVAIGGQTLVWKAGESSPHRIDSFALVNVACEIGNEIIDVPAPRGHHDRWPREPFGP